MAEITYVPIACGFMYRVAVMDWHSCKVLSWRVSNTLESHFSTQALQGGIRALRQARDLQHRSGLTVYSTAFTQVLKDRGMAISMDGRGRCQNNIFIERLWWALKHHYLYLHSFDTGSQLREGLARWVRFYNHERGHSSLDDRTPDKVFFGLPHPFAEAA